MTLLHQTLNRISQYAREVFTVHTWCNELARLDALRMLVGIEFLERHGDAKGASLRLDALLLAIVQDEDLERAWRNRAS